MSGKIQTPEEFADNVGTWWDDESHGLADIYALVASRDALVRADEREKLLAEPTHAELSRALSVSQNLAEEMQIIKAALFAARCQARRDALEEAARKIDEFAKKLAAAYDSSRDRGMIELGKVRLETCMTIHSEVLALKERA